MQCEHPIHLTIECEWSPSGYRDIVAGCGKCPACQVNHRKYWYFRLKLETDSHLCSYVATLTYDDVSLPVPVEDGVYHPINYADVQKLHKKLRKKYSFRFFCVCEYGAMRLRPHYHVVYWFDEYVRYLDFLDDLYKSWFDGTCRISLDTTNDRAAEYILKYCLKPQDLDQDHLPLLRCSNRPCIGYYWLTRPEVVDFFRNTRKTQSSYLGFRQELPRLFKSKIFTDEERYVISKLQEYESYEKFMSNIQDYIKDLDRQPLFDPPIVQNRRVFNYSVEKKIQNHILK